ncbi:MAG: DUF2064 domain-containing protein [Acidobacteriota bacterium]
MARHLILFAREPAREAREKGLRGAEAAELFAAFAAGWAKAARRAGARLVVATPPEDRRAWARHFEQAPIWLDQRGATFGGRLERAARDAARLPGRAILVGGDVVPDPARLLEAFEGLEAGAEAAVVPAPDGGVSLIGLAEVDLDLLGRLSPRRADVCSSLCSALARRGRRVLVLERTADVDGRRALRALSRAAPCWTALARRVLRHVVARSPSSRRPCLYRPDRALPILRAPPLAA